MRINTQSPDTSIADASIEAVLADWPHCYNCAERYRPVPLPRFKATCPTCSMMRRKMQLVYYFGPEFRKEYNELNWQYKQRNRQAVERGAIEPRTESISIGTVGSIFDPDNTFKWTLGEL